MSKKDLDPKQRVPVCKYCCLTWQYLETCSTRRLVTTKNQINYIIINNIIVSLGDPLEAPVECSAVIAYSSSMVIERSQVRVSASSKNVSGQNSIGQQYNKAIFNKIVKFRKFSILRVFLKNYLLFVNGNNFKIPHFFRILFWLSASIKPNFQNNFATRVNIYVKISIFDF